MAMLLDYKTEPAVNADVELAVFVGFIVKNEPVR